MGMCSKPTSCLLFSLAVFFWYISQYMQIGVRSILKLTAIGAAIASGMMIAAMMNRWMYILMGLKCYIVMIGGFQLGKIDDCRD